MRVEIDGVRHHKCDYCRRDFTEEQAEHITIEMDMRSGLSSPHNEIPGWRFKRIFKPVHLDFCVPGSIDSSSCVGRFFYAMSKFHKAMPEYAEGNFDS